MLQVLAFLVVAALLVGFAWWMAALPGSVAIHAGAFDVAAPTPVALLAAMVLFAALYILIRLLAMVVRLPRRNRQIRAGRARIRGDRAVARTLLALASGDADRARSEAQRGRSLLGDTPQTLLLSAYAARLGGNREQADEAFTALASRSDAAFLGLRGLLQGAIARGDLDAANALALKAAEVAPKAPWLRAERERLAIRSGAWKDALALGGGGAAAALATAASAEETDPKQARRLAQQAWKADPGFSPGALAYVRRLREIGKEKQAQSVLRESWASAPHPALGEASLAGGGFMSAESRAEWLVKAKPDHPESLLLRSRAALDSGNFTKARQFAETAREGGLQERRVWLLLATIGEREDNMEATSEALRQAARAPADPHWRCEACNTPHADWHPICAECGEAGRITWGTQVGRGSRAMLMADPGFAILP